MNLGSIAVVSTAFRRPDYLRQALASWRAARGISEVRSFTLALGWDESTHMAALGAWEGFWKASGLDQRPGGPMKARIKMDSSAARRSNGMHRAIGEAGNHVLKDPAVDFAVFTEEDIVVSSDVLELMAWAREEFASDERVLCVCAHNAGGQGWDERRPAGDADADQETVRLLPYFNPWCWGTWRDRWERVLEPSWDWECSSGTRGYDSGYDWNLQARVIPQGGYLCVIPDASRSQNIGKDDGWAANPADFANTQAASFRADRGRVTYRLAEAGEQAA